MDETTAPVTFTIAELWLLHSVVRHEMQTQETWKLPPVSFDLNEQISDALLAADKYGVMYATLLLTLHSCLVIDFHIRADMKTPEGAYGYKILLKAFAARAALNGDLPDAGVTDSGYGEALKARHNVEEE